jgi:4-amino-4-deoxy-L-arabinose transferase-like glycosyltransferase
MTTEEIPRLSRRAVVALFLVALAARLAAIAVVGFSTIGFGDAPAYLAGARSLAETGRYPLRTDSFFFRPPGYAAFLTAVTLGHPDRIALAKVVNAGLGALAALLLAALSARIFRSRPAALATGLLAAVHPSFVLVASDVQSESLFLVLLLGSAFLLLAASDRPSSNLALLAGASLGLAALTRASALAVVPLVAAPLLDRRVPSRVRAHLAVAGLVGVFAAVAPWTLRNAIVFGRFIPVSDMAGSTLYDGNSEWTRRFYRLRDRADYDRWIVAIDRDKNEQIAALAKTDPAAAAHPSDYFGRLAREEIRAHPAATLALAGHKALDWLRPTPNPWFWPRAVVVPVGILYSVLFALAALGLATAARRGVAAFCLAVLAVTMLFHVALLVVWRYRVPYWDPILLLYAPPGALWLARRL